MEHNIKIVHADEMAEHIKALLKETNNVPIVISGNSMSPFLVHGRDTVFLSNIDKLKRGDMVFYKRSDGSCVLHRVYRVTDDSCDMVGDAQTFIEKNVKFSDMTAVVTAIKRKGKLLRQNSFCWMFFAKVWIRMIRMRPLLVKLYTKLSNKG